jgi:hypothetical protein
MFPNAALAKLCDVIIKSEFIRNHRLEPTIGSKEGRELLKQIEDMPGHPPMASQDPDDSIYVLFVSDPSNKCLICGKTKNSPSMLGCVRRHLDHRPFRCAGKSGGCKSCPENDVYVVLSPLPNLTDYVCSLDASTSTDKKANQAICHFTVLMGLGVL